MRKRTMLLGLTVLVSILYAAVFIVVFSQNESDQKTVLLQHDKSEETQSIDTLYWLQAGVFQEESSYQSLKRELEDQGLSVYCIESYDLTRIVVMPDSDEQEVIRTMNELAICGIETIVKHADLNEDQKKMAREGKMEELLKGLHAE